MATAIEALGMSLPYNSSSLADSDEKREECLQAGKAMENLLKMNLNPRVIMTKAVLVGWIHLSTAPNTIRFQRSQHIYVCALVWAQWLWCWFTRSCRS